MSDAYVMVSPGEAVKRHEYVWTCGCEMEVELDEKYRVVNRYKRGPLVCTADHVSDLLANAVSDPYLVSWKAFKFVKDYLKTRYRAPHYRSKQGSWVACTGQSFQRKDS